MKTHYDVDVPGEIVKENTANNPQNTRWWFATEPGASLCHHCVQCIELMHWLGYGKRSRQNLNSWEFILRQLQNLLQSFYRSTVLSVLYTLSINHCLLYSLSFPPWNCIHNLVISLTSIYFVHVCSNLHFKYINPLKLLSSMLITNYYIHFTFKAIIRCTYTHTHTSHPPSLQSSVRLIKTCRADQPVDQPAAPADHYISQQQQQLPLICTRARTYENEVPKSLRSL